ncbi:hypothetical protein HPP92_018595 [Vanilla planifolia]|nr:hypothetical protein HPP92_018595 [Vanilla planifolia]
MAEQLPHHYDWSFHGCIGNLVHFLDFHHHLRLRKMKMLTYRRHGEGKHAARNKVSKTAPDTPSTSEQHTFAKDACLMEEKTNETRKHSGKSSLRILNHKRRSRERNQKPKNSAPAPRLLRTASIHHKSDDPVNKLNSGEENLRDELSTDANYGSANIEQVNILPSTYDVNSYGKQCDEHGTFNKRTSAILLEEPEKHLKLEQSPTSNLYNGMEVASPVEKDRDVKELHEDVILHPSKEFLAMMKLFNGNVQLIQKILEDPSYIFAHYSQGQQDSSAELTRTFSFPASWQPETKKDAIFGVENKSVESEYVVKQSANFHSDDSPSHPDASVGEKLEPCAANQVESTSYSNVVVPSSILHAMKSHPSNRFKVIKQKIKDLIRENRKEHRGIFMDGIVHKIPYGKCVSKDIKKSKSGQWEGRALQMHDRDRSRNITWKNNDSLVQKSMTRCQSLDDSMLKYSRLFDSISSRDFKRLPESLKLMKEDGDTAEHNFTGKTFGRILSLSSIEYSSRKDVCHELSLSPSSPKDTSFEQKEESCVVKESNRTIGETSAEWILNDNGNILSPLDEPEGPEPSLGKEDLFKEVNYTTPEKGTSSEAYTVGKSKEPNSIGFGLKYHTETACSSDCDVNCGPEIGEIDIESSQKLACVDLSCFVQVDQKYAAEFDYVSKILKNSGFSGHEFLGAWHSPFQPLDPIMFDEEYGLAQETGISGIEHGKFLGQMLLFDLTNEVLVEVFEDSFGYVLPWLSSFNVHFRRVPTGNHILQEVWAHVYWHLKGQPQHETLLDDTVARDFKKNDGWMNLIYDSEDVELEVEDMILDDLLDDFILQLAGFVNCTKPIFSLKL